jgi:hypothetical protein
VPAHPVVMLRYAHLVKLILVDANVNISHKIKSVSQSRLKMGYMWVDSIALLPKSSFFVAKFFVLPQGMSVVPSNFKPTV